MTKLRPSKGVLRAFGAPQELLSLGGGEGRCWRAGSLVFKPCDDEVAWCWLAEQLSTVRSDGFRLPLPVSALDGRWCVDGWCAQEAVAGAHPQRGRWSEVLAVGALFHAALAHVPRPAFIDQRDDPWAYGGRVAWQELAPPSGCAELDQLLALRRSLSLPSQLIHGDLSENILFSPTHLPAIIDISPYWRPAGFASAIVVADAVCWRGADPVSLLQCVEHIASFPQLFVRALIYRMGTTIATGIPDLSGYAPGIEFAVQLVD